MLKLEAFVYFIKKYSIKLFLVYLSNTQIKKSCHFSYKLIIYFTKIVDILWNIPQVISKWPLNLWSVTFLFKHIKNIIFYFSTISQISHKALKTLKTHKLCLVEKSARRKRKKWSKKSEFMECLLLGMWRHLMSFWVYYLFIFYSFKTSFAWKFSFKC